MSVSKSKRDIYCSEAIALYKTLDPSAGYLMVESLNGSYYLAEENIRRTIAYASKHKRKGFYPVSYTPVKSSIISYAKDTKFEALPHNNRKRGLVIADRTGMFVYEFSDGTVMIIAKWWAGTPANPVIVTLLVATESTFYNFNKYYTDYRVQTERPKIGIYTAKTDSMGIMHYKKLDKIQHTPVVHSAVAEVTNDMNSYFENVKDFTRYGMSGVRKVLLIGPPGTGKSSYAYAIASAHKDKMSVVFADCINSVANHLRKCCKANIPTIIIWEDAESTGLNRAGSDILNFLDGIDQPQTKAGAYIMMTTNFPELIDKRIKKRPGRVDKIIEFGVLTDEFALQCANIYFSDLFPYSYPPTSLEAQNHFQELADIVTGMGGAAIKGLAYASKLYAAGHKETVTLDLIRRVKEGMDEDLAKVDKYGEAPEEELKPVGFGKATKRAAKIDWKQNFI
jgi:AAA+ superfamily predicted ATPase